MFDLIRKLLFLLALSVIVVSGYYLYTNYSALSALPVKVNLSETGPEIEIDNFKVLHEVSGRKDWELKAGHAEVDYDKNLTRMEHVELEFERYDKQKFWVSADQGTLNNDTKDFQLEGHVKLIAESGTLARQLRKRKNLNKMPN